MTFNYFMNISIYLSIQGLVLFYSLLLPSGEFFCSAAKVFKLNFSCLRFLKQVHNNIIKGILQTLKVLLLI